VVSRAESVVAKVHQDELLALQKAAYRGVRRAPAGTIRPVPDLCDIVFCTSNAMIYFASPEPEARFRERSVR